jgi:hypothetical protein
VGGAARVLPRRAGAYDELGLAGSDTLELLQLAPTPAAAAALRVEEIGAVLKGAHRKRVAAKADGIAVALGAEQLSSSSIVTSAYAATVTA